MQSTLLEGRLSGTLVDGNDDPEGTKLRLSLILFPKRLNMAMVEDELKDKK